MLLQFNIDKRVCEQDVTKSSRKPGYICANIPPDAKVLEAAHKACDDWRPGTDRKMDEQCNDLVALPPKKQQ